MASKGVNKVILVGNLGADPEVRCMPNGNAVANFSLATSESWIDKQSNEKQERTEWHRVVLFGKLAEIAREYLRKGSLVYIEGSLQTRKWQDNTGLDRYTTEVIVNVGGTMQMLGGRQQNSGVSMNDGPQARLEEGMQGTVGQTQQPSSSNQFNNKPATRSAPASPLRSSAEPTMDFDDDIPF